MLRLFPNPGSALLRQFPKSRRSLDDEPEKANTAGILTGCSAILLPFRANAAGLLTGLQCYRTVNPHFRRPVGHCPLLALSENSWVANRETIYSLIIHPLILYFIYTLIIKAFSTKDS